MKWSRQGNEKLRLLLNKTEAEKFGLLGAYEGQICRKEVERLLEAKQNETGFNIRGMQAVVQLFPNDNGGIELLVTKINNLSGENNNKFFFIFENSEELIKCCERIEIEDSELYSCEERLFILGVNKNNNYNFEIMCEYGDEINFEEFDFRENPEIKFLCSNAIEKIKAAFKD